jgi:hypothetical protein
MLLYFTLKSHTSPPLRYVPVIGYKGTKSNAQYKAKCVFFVFIGKKTLYNGQFLSIFGDYHE